jgi:hypothetical protein
MATDFLEHMASIVAICLENVINIERLKHLGLMDPLTGALPVCYVSLSFFAAEAIYSFPRRSQRCH